ncbi:fluoride efflux transporter FluC [Corynebacterium aquilae]|uniref:Fluoride-specific ion channel FluC n=1 Tax=Corynebacterium aquilae DSM 44791 TaxID=1431546 RepID=A0A1L7CHP2_9CORY|nr:CrcB family protein [Corynebacterium aquilae]APT85372.1 hypothetical protein CAQU_10245 [Corynebacterium aquilae DSM 44791]
MTLLTHTLIPIIVGGFCGGVSRYTLSKLPHGTHVANMFACIVLGIVTAIASHAPWAVFLGVGFAGALSTWSTLAKELGQHFKQHRPTAYLHASIAVTTGMAMFVLGSALGSLVH